MRATYGEDKIAAHAKIEADTQEFLERGGKIQECDHTLNLSFREKNLTLNRKKQIAKQRREFQINNKASMKA